MKEWAYKKKKWRRTFDQTFNHNGSATREEVQLAKTTLRNIQTLPEPVAHKEFAISYFYAEIRHAVRLKRVLTELVDGEPPILIMVKFLGWHGEISFGSNVAYAEMEYSFAQREFGRKRMSYYIKRDTRLLQLGMKLSDEHVNAYPEAQRLYRFSVPTIFTTEWDLYRKTFRSHMQLIRYYDYSPNRSYQCLTGIRQHRPRVWTSR